MGTTLLLVSHDRNMITSSCGRCILMDGGRIAMDGSPASIFDYYYAMASSKNGSQILRTELDSGLFQVTSGTREATVESIRILDASDKVLDVMEVGKQVAIEFVVCAHQEIPRLILGFVIRDQLGQIVFSTNTSRYEKTLANLQPSARYMFKFFFQANMGVGSYSISTLLVGSNDRFACNYESRELACFFEIENRTHPVFGGNAWLNPKLVVEAR
jgi:lipopolysaccharide transport system ATP-binding protein